LIFRLRTFMAFHLGHFWQLLGSHNQVSYATNCR